jgi:hypothetical protein
MPAPTGPLLGLLLGALLARARADENRRERAGIEPLALVTLFALLVFAPTAAYYMALEPYWSYAYFIESLPRISALNAVVLLADVASVPLGFTLALRARGTKQLSTLTRLVGFPVLGICLFLVLLFPRLSVQATYSQFHGDFGTRPVAGSPLGYALIWTTLVLVSSISWTALALRRMP